MRKVIILNGSPRKGNTRRQLERLQAVLGASERGIDSEIIDIGRLDIKACRGCENCLRNGSCLIDDDAAAVFRKIAAADGLIAGTPVYLKQISGSLKNLIDRGCSWYHRSPVTGKPFFALATTQATGAKQTAAYLRDLAVQWGMIPAGSLQNTGFNLKKEINPLILKNFIRYLEPGSKRSFSPPLGQIIEYNNQKLVAMHVLDLDRKYWTEQGWNDSPFYFRCRMNPVWRIIGGIYFRIGSRFIGKSAGQRMKEG